MEICSICIEPIETGRNDVRLECGHVFHGDCAVQWFRYNHTSCPLCRSVDLESRWRQATPCQRIACLKRVRHNMPPCVQRRIGEYEALSKEQREHRRSLMSFRMQNNGIIKEHDKRQRLYRRYTFKRMKLQEELSNLDIPNAPRLLPTDSTFAMLSADESE